MQDVGTIDSKLHLICPQVSQNTIKSLMFFYKNRLLHRKKVKMLVAPVSPNTSYKWWHTLTGHKPSKEFMVETFQHSRISVLNSFLVASKLVICCALHQTMKSCTGLVLGFSKAKILRKSGYFDLCKYKTTQNYDETVDTDYWIKLHQQPMKKESWATKISCNCLMWIKKTAIQNWSCNSQLVSECSCAVST